MLEPTAAFMGEEAGTHPTQVTSLSGHTLAHTRARFQSTPPGSICESAHGKMIEDSLEVTGC